MFDDEASDAEEQRNDASLKLHARSLRKVLEASDVLIEVLDARDPVGTRCRAVEKELKSLDGGRKKLVLVLNKIGKHFRRQVRPSNWKLTHWLSLADLVPPPVVQAWLAHLRLQAPTIAFKSSTQQQRQHLSASSVHTPGSASGSSTKPLLELIKGFRLGANPGQASDSKAKTSLTIGLIGHPNVGKSSLINTLKRSKACSVAPTPGWTKEVQEVVLEKGVRVLDCPGVVVEARGRIEAALRGMIKPEEVEDAKAPIEIILQRCKKEHLQMLYNIPYFDGVLGFLLAVARGKGRLKKGGVPDLDGTARSVLRDWVSGRIPYYTTPPAAPSSAAIAAANASNLAGQASEATMVSADDVGGTTLLTSFAPEFDLAALLGEADELAFGEGGLAGSAVVGKGVKMAAGDEEPEDAEVGWEMEEEVEDDGLNVDDLIEDDDDAEFDSEADEDEDEEMSEDEPVPAPAPVPAPKSNKKQVNIVSTAPKGKNKSVSFSAKPLGPTAGSGVAAPPALPTKQAAGGAAAQAAKLFADDEAPLSLNKDIKKNSKKDKKAKAKQAKIAAEIKAVERMHGEDADLPSKPRGAQTVKVGGTDAYAEAYDFAEFFPSAGGKKKAAAAEMDLDE